MKSKTSEQNQIINLVGALIKTIRKLFSNYQGTTAEATVVQQLNQGAPTNGLYIICGGLFLLLFWTSKKVNKRNAAA